MSEVCKLLDIEKTRTTSLHPQSDGQVERYNRTLIEMLRDKLKESQGVLGQATSHVHDGVQSFLRATLRERKCKMMRCDSKEKKRDCSKSISSSSTIRCWVTFDHSRKYHNIP